MHVRTLFRPRRAPTKYGGLKDLIFGASINSVPHKPRIAGSVGHEHLLPADAGVSCATRYLCRGKCPPLVGAGAAT